MSIRRTIHFSGQVQGVGFRYAARRLARSFDVVGYVKNLSDGRVELVAEGTPEEIDRFVGAIEGEMEGLIRGTGSVDAPATCQYGSFDIAF